MTGVLSLPHLVGMGPDTMHTMGLTLARTRGAFFAAAHGPAMPCYDVCVRKRSATCGTGETPGGSSGAGGGGPAAGGRGTSCSPNTPSPQPSLLCSSACAKPLASPRKSWLSVRTSVGTRSMRWSAAHGSRRARIRWPCWPPPWRSPTRSAAHC
jgi:hypothetical protein